MSINQEHLDEWIKVLRSGDYEQYTGGSLHVFEDERHKYCCLGVGCEVAQIPGTALESSCDDNDDPASHVTVFVHGGDTDFQPDSFDSWLGLPEGGRISLDGSIQARDTIFGDKGTITLDRLNDWGFTFDQIADLIEYFGLTSSGYDL